MAIFINLSSDLPLKRKKARTLKKGVLAHLGHERVHLHYFTIDPDRPSQDEDFEVLHGHLYQFYHEMSP